MATSKVKYQNRIIHIPFPELAGCENDEDPNTAHVWLKIRNPRLMAGGELIGKGANVTKNADGSVTMGEGAQEEAYEGFAKLIIAGVVPDPDDDSDEPELLPMPPSGKDLNRFPIEILNKLGTVINDSVPH